MPRFYGRAANGENVIFGLSTNRKAGFGEDGSGNPAIMSPDGTVGLTVTDSGVSIVGANLLPDGTVSLPGGAFASDLDTGLYRIGANNAGFAAAGAKVLDISATGLGVVGTILNGNGAVATPAFSFTSDPDSGMYRIGANNLGVGVNGAKVLDISTTGLGVVGTMLSGDGTVSLPGIGFSSDTDNGFYRIGANNWGAAVAGAQVLDLSATGLGVVGTILNGNGAVGTPAFGFTSDPDSGMYRIGANNLGLAVNGTKILDVGTGGAGVTGLLSSTADFIVGGTARGGALTDYVLTGTKTGLTDTTATAVIQVTVPNAQHAFCIEIDVIGIMGAGGAVGAGETVKKSKYQIAGVRTAGVDCVVTVGTVIESTQAKVAGADDITSTVVTCSAMTGAVGATQTFNILVAITKGGGAADNHVAVWKASLLNQGASGVSMATA